MNHDELRKTAEAAFSHRHTSECYKESSGPWCEWEPTNLQHWLTVLALLDEHAALGETASELIRHLADRMIDCPRCDDLRERLTERVRV